MQLNGHAQQSEKDHDSGPWPSLRFGSGAQAKLLGHSVAAGLAQAT